MDVEVLKLVSQLGMDAILLFLLFQLWTAFQEQNRFIRDMLLDGESERLAILQALGAEHHALELKAAKLIQRQIESDSLN